MADIETIQSGAWSNPATWTGGVIPDLSRDVAILKHTVTIANGDTLVVTGSGGIEIVSTRTLTINGSLTLENGGYLAASSGYLLMNSLLSSVTVGDDGYLNVGVGGILDYGSGLLEVASGGLLEISSGGRFLIGVGLEITLDIRAGGRVNCEGMIEIGANDALTIHPGGSLRLAAEEASISTWFGTLNVYGSLEMAPDSWLQIGASATVRFQRRDGRLFGGYDGAAHSVIDMARAYGVSPRPTHVGVMGL